MEGTVHDTVKVLSHHLPGGTEENKKPVRIASVSAEF
jgi:hypothetical protein